MGMPETGEEEDILLKAVRRLNQTGDNGSSEGEGAEAQEKHTTRNSAQAAVTSQSRGRSFDEKNPLFRASSLDSNSSWASGLRKSRSPLGESPRRRYPAAPLLRRDTVQASSILVYATAPMSTLA